MTDDQLVRALRRGDPAAAAALYALHGAAVHRWAMAVVGRRHDAEEVVQATMLRALEALRTDPPRHLEAWLKAVARNESIDLLRRRRDHDAIRDDARPGPSTADVAGLREDARQALADLAALPDRQRAALVLRELHDLSHREVAQALGIGSGAARQAVLQARRSLRERVAGRGMPCDTIRVLLEDGDRRRRRAVAVQAHLDACTRCAHAAAVRLRSLIPAPWLAVIGARVGGNGHAGRIAAGAAASLAVVAGGAGLLSRDTPSPRPAAPLAVAGIPRDPAQRPARPALDGGAAERTRRAVPREAGRTPVRPLNARPMRTTAPPTAQPVTEGGRGPAAGARGRSPHHNPGHYVKVGDHEVEVENDNAPGAGVEVDPEDGSVRIEMGGCLELPPIFGCPEDDGGGDEAAGG